MADLEQDLPALELDSPDLELDWTTPDLDLAAPDLDWSHPGLVSPDRELDWADTEWWPVYTLLMTAKGELRDVTRCERMSFQLRMPRTPR